MTLYGRRLLLGFIVPQSREVCIHKAIKVQGWIMFYNHAVQSGSYKVSCLIACSCISLGFTWTLHTDLLQAVHELSDGYINIPTTESLLHVSEHSSPLSMGAGAPYSVGVLLAQSGPKRILTRRIGQCQKHFIKNNMKLRCDKPFHGWSIQKMLLASIFKLSKARMQFPLSHIHGSKTKSRQPNTLQL